MRCRYAARAAALGVALALFAAPAAHASTIFTARLTGDQETPPTGSTAFGVGYFSLNDAETALTFNVTFTGLSRP